MTLCGEGAIFPIVLSTQFQRPQMKEPSLSFPFLSLTARAVHGVKSWETIFLPGMGFSHRTLSSKS